MKVVTSKPGHSTRSVSFAQSIQRLVDLGLDLIPLHPAGKVPIEKAWTNPVQRQIGAVTGRFVDAVGGDPTLPAAQYCEQFANVGILNETSKTVVLDCDDPRAVKALQAVAHASGKTFEPSKFRGYWKSIKGPKIIFQAPTQLPIQGTHAELPRRAVFRVWNGTAFDVIFELRGTGQDVIPPSVRNVNGKIVALGWHKNFAVEPMPDWLAYLYGIVGTGQSDGYITAMLEAIGIDPKDWTRDEQYGGTQTAYPRDLDVHKQARIWCKTHFDIPTLLGEYGYEQDGARWRPKGTTSPAGIMKGTDKFMWRCEHQNALIAGPFDAWRLIVVHRFNNDVRAALKWYQTESRARLSKKATAPDPMPDQSGASDEEIEWAPRRVNNAPMIVTPAKPVMDGFLHLTPGMHLLCANPKTGKSLVASLIATAYTSGAVASGFRCDEPGDILYAAFDETYQASTMPRMAALARHFDSDENTVFQRTHFFAKPGDLVDWATENNLSVYEPMGVAGDTMTDEEIDVKYDGQKFTTPVFNVAIRALYHYLKTFGIKLCVIDLAQTIIAQGNTRENVARTEYAAFVALQLVAVELDCAIVGLHQYNKASGTIKDAAKMGLHAKISGTNGLLGALTSLIGIDPLGGIDDEDLFNVEPVGRKVQIEQIGRDMKGMEKTAFSLQMHQPEGCHSPGFTLAYVGRPELLANDDIRTWVLHYLADQIDWVTLPSIHTAAKAAGAYDGVLRSFKKILISMSKTGDVDGKHGAGYRINDTGRKKTARPY